MCVCIYICVYIYIYIYIYIYKEMKRYSNSFWIKAQPHPNKQNPHTSLSFSLYTTKNFTHQNSINRSDRRVQRFLSIHFLERISRETNESLPIYHNSSSACYLKTLCVDKVYVFVHFPRFYRNPKSRWS